jgi:hypothetical protein
VPRNRVLDEHHSPNASLVELHHRRTARRGSALARRGRALRSDHHGSLLPTPGGCGRPSCSATRKSGTDRGNDRAHYLDHPFLTSCVSRGIATAIEKPSCRIKSTVHRHRLSIPRSCPGRTPAHCNRGGNRSCTSTSFHPSLFVAADRNRLPPDCRRSDTKLPRKLGSAGPSIHCPSGTALSWDFHARAAQVAECYLCS